MTMHRVHQLAQAAFLCVAALGLGACTSALTPLGENSYDCNRKENPASPYCHSFRSVERGTTGPLPDSRYDQVMRLSDHDRLTGIAPDSQASTGATPASAAQQPSQLSPQQAPATRAAKPVADAPEVPVRVGPLVQRVWVKRHVDANDMLISETHLYKEIVPAHWSGVVAGDRSSGTAAAVYPHRPAGGTEPPSPKPSRDGAAPPPTEFVQPGAPKASEPADVAPVPAIPSGTPSLPQ